MEILPSSLYLLDVCDPEYHAAASVVLMTTSTGTRSATASLAALIVRRIPLPACSQCSDSWSVTADRVSVLSDAENRSDGG